MIPRIVSVWSGFVSDGSGFFSGTVLILLVMVSVHGGGIQASLSLGPEGNFPGIKDVLLYALSHDDAPSLLVNVCCLLLVGPCQERHWGTVAFLALSAFSMAAVPCVYSLVLWVGLAEASRVCGYSAVQLALFTAQCRQVRRRRLLWCVPSWLLPWLALLLDLLLLPGSPALLHLCAICIGYNYSPFFIGSLQELESFSCMDYIPKWAYVSASSRLRLPTVSTCHRSNPIYETLHREDKNTHLDNPGWGPDPLHTETVPGLRIDLSYPGAGFGWDRSYGASEAELTEEQLLHAGILASLQDTSDCSCPGHELQEYSYDTVGVPSSIQEILHPSEAKVELPKSSVSSLRLQQLERMGFPTEKSVVALAASKHLEGAVSLLIDDSIGSEAVVVGAKSSGPPLLR